MSPVGQAQGPRLQALQGGVGSRPSLLESWLGLEQSCGLAWKGQLRLASWPVISCTDSGSSSGEGPISGHPVHLHRIRLKNGKKKDIEYSIP
jgi:hypothetical protein